MSQPILNPDIANYLSTFHKNILKHPVRREMECYARECNFPCVGELVGQLLYLLARSINAKRVFELGSGFGYSAFWFASAVGEEGKVYCTDGDEKNVKRAEDYLTRAELWKRVTYFTGYAQQHFQNTDGIFDIIYNDVDKDQYPGVFELVAPRVRSGGFYIADNALWSGRVIEASPEEKPQHAGWTEAIKKHNEMVFNHQDFEASIIPLRDGVIIARRKG